MTSAAGDRGPRSPPRLPGARADAALSRQRRLLAPLQLPYLPPLPAGWPLAALVVGYPLWWALGLGVLAFPVFALPMAVELLRRRPLKLPPLFGVWLVFLAWLLISASMLGYDPPGTYGQFDVSRVLAVCLRFVQYAAVTVILLYIGNLTERELPRKRLVRMLGVFFLVTVAGGFLGLLLPRLEWTSPVELALPGWLASNGWVESMVHPATAQVHEFLGHATGRPSAPFGYTNTWGQMLNLLLPWFIVGWFAWGNQLRRPVAVVMVGLAIVPAVFSLNRGLWLGVGLASAYFALRLAVRGKLWGLGVLATALVVGTIVFTVTPLHAVVQDRFANQHSNDRRMFTTVRTLEVTTHSPVLGFGTTRDARGSSDSIVVGNSASCASCGNPVLGMNGQIWLILISQGYVGAALYVAFFVGVLLRYGRDPTPVGIAGTLTLLLSLYYMLVYNSLPAALSVHMIAVALLWRNEMEREAAGAGDPGPPARDERFLAGGTP